MRKTGLGVLLALVFVGGLMTVASEFGGEVVVLTTRDGDGTPHETSLWVADDAGAIWLRAGDPNSKWLIRLRANPAVLLKRAGEISAYRAEVVAGRQERINQQMAEGYGWADWVIGAMRESSQVSAIRLVPMGR